MNVKEIPKEIEDLLHLNGEYQGVKVGGRSKPAEDIPRLCKVILTLYDWVASRDKSKIVQISEMRKRITDLEAEVKGLKMRTLGIMPEQYDYSTIGEQE